MTDKEKDATVGSCEADPEESLYLYTAYNLNLYAADDDPDCFVAAGGFTPDQYVAVRVSEIEKQIEELQEEIAYIKKISWEVEALRLASGEDIQKFKSAGKCYD